jgi:hypothetical protein
VESTKNNQHNIYYTKDLDMKDSRYKEIMEGLGMPNSRSLLFALQQVANEVAQETKSLFSEKNRDVETLEACDRWESLMASDRIRFIGSARLGKEMGQVLCVEFHSDHTKDPDGQVKRETALSIERLTKYTDTMMRRKSSTDL